MEGEREGGRLAADRFGNTVAKETTGGAEGSCRQSADTLWVNPFKHDLLSSLFRFRPSLPPPLRPTPAANGCPPHPWKKKKKSQF